MRSPGWPLRDRLCLRQCPGDLPSGARLDVHQKHTPRRFGGFDQRDIQKQARHALAFMGRNKLQHPAAIGGHAGQQAHQKMAVLLGQVGGAQAAAPLIPLDIGDRQNDRQAKLLFHISRRDHHLRESQRQHDDGQRREQPRQNAGGQQDQPAAMPRRRRRRRLDHPHIGLGARKHIGQLRVLDTLGQAGGGVLDQVPCLHQAAVLWPHGQQFVQSVGDGLQRLGQLGPPRPQARRIALGVRQLGLELLVDGIDPSPAGGELLLRRSADLALNLSNLLIQVGHQRIAAGVFRRRLATLALQRQQRLGQGRRFAECGRNLPKAEGFQAFWPCSGAASKPCRLAWPTERRWPEAARPALVAGFEWP